VDPGRDELSVMLLSSTSYPFPDISFDAPKLSVTCMSIYDPNDSELTQTMYDLLLVTGCLDGSIYVWNLCSREIVTTMKKNHAFSHTKKVNTLFVYSPVDEGTKARGRPLVVSGSYDNTIVVWDLITGKVRHRMAGEGSTAHSAPVC